MAHFHSRAKPPFHPYRSAKQHADTPPSMQMDYYQYSSEASTSTPFMKSQETFSSQLQVLSDLPDLYYDHDFPSPPSASSSNMICTPPLDWQAPWQKTESKCELNNNSSYLHPWDSAVVDLGEAASFDSNFSWMYQQRTSAEQPESMNFANYDAFDPMPQIDPHCSSYPQTIPNTQTNTNYTFALSPSLSSSITTSSPLSDDNMHSASTSCPPPAANQVPLKLHQPRPSRRIPIISLSKLASACDTYPIYSPPQEPTDRISKAAKACLGLGGHSSRSYLPNSHRSNDQINFSRRHFHSIHGLYDNSLVGITSDSGQMARCPCGCRESYIRQ